MSRPLYRREKVLKEKNFAREQQVVRANFASVMAHTRSTAAKVLLDGINPSSFYWRFEAVSFSCCLIVLTSGLVRPVAPTCGYRVWRATCSAGPRLFPIFLNDDYDDENKILVRAPEVRGIEVITTKY